MTTEFRIRLDALIVDPSDSPREELVQSRIRELVDMEGSWYPVTVRDDQGQWRLVDGFHRIAAARILGLDDIDAVEDAGDWEIAAIALNNHGAPLTTRQKHDWFRDHLATKTFDIGTVPQTDMARKLGVSSATVQHWVEEYRQLSHINMRKVSALPTPDNGELLRRAVEDGVPKTELAREYDLDDWTIANRITREKARRYDELQALEMEAAPDVFRPAGSPPRQHVNITEEMKRRNLQKSAQQLAAEYYEAARRHALGSLIFASEEHFTALRTLEGDAAVLRELGQVEETCLEILQAVRSHMQRIQSGDLAGAIVDGEVIHRG